MSSISATAYIEVWARANTYSEIASTSLHAVNATRSQESDSASATAASAPLSSTSAFGARAGKFSHVGSARYSCEPSAEKEGHQFHQ